MEQIKNNNTIKDLNKKEEIQLLLNKLSHLDDENNKAFDELINNGEVSLEDIKTVWDTKEKLSTLKRIAWQTLYELDKSESLKVTEELKKKTIINKTEHNEEKKLNLKFNVIQQLAVNTEFYFDILAPLPIKS